MPKKLPVAAAGVPNAPNGEAAGVDPNKPVAAGAGLDPNKPVAGAAAGVDPNKPVAGAAAGVDPNKPVPTLHVDPFILTQPPTPHKGRKAAEGDLPRGE